MQHQIVHYSTNYRPTSSPAIASRCLGGNQLSFELKSNWIFFQTYHSKVIEWTAKSSKNDYKTIFFEIFLAHAAVFPLCYGFLFVYTCMCVSDSNRNRKQNNPNVAFLPTNKYINNISYMRWKCNRCYGYVNYKTATKLINGLNNPVYYLFIWQQSNRRLSYTHARTRRQSQIFG